MQNSLSTQQVSKLGNTLIYLANNVGDLNKTKVLKLLYLIEEKSIKKFGYPFFGVDFQLWQFGPVLKDIYIDLSEETLQILNAYIARATYDNNIFVANAEFNDDEFSDDNIYLLESIANFAKHKTARDLVDFTHNENSLWKLSALKNGVYEKLESKAIKSTEYLIDFSLLFDKNTFQEERYNSAVSNLEFINYFKR